MATSSLAFGQDRSARENALTRFALAGATVALLDGAFAVVVYVFILHLTTAGRVFQSVASGLLGKASFNGGAATVALGAACHIFIAFSWTTVYFVASRRIASIREFASSNVGSMITGLVFGAAMWLGMDFIVIPLSAATFTPPSSWQFWLQLVWHIVALGPPIVRILR